MVVGAGASVGLLLVDAPEALLQTGVDDFSRFCRSNPICGASLHRCGSGAHSLSVIEADGLKALVIPVPTGVVNVEP